MRKVILSTILMLTVSCAEEDYTANNYPNPKRGSFKECGLRSAGLVCDPYETLSESERMRINTQLVNFVSKTEQNNNNDFCSKKGTDAMFVIINKASQQFADELRQRWSDIDTQCGRFGLLVLSLEDRSVYGSFDQRSPINMIQLQAIIQTEDNHIKTGSYTTAVTNILKEVAASMTPQAGTTTKKPETTTKFSPATNLSILSLLAILFCNLF
uniref:TPM_phosphatase domain-containing protein n=1 Tax=Caenorhabditis tropicalis TaxID=1561998 RepID=A0A1I7V3L9_9PELO